MTWLRKIRNARGSLNGGMPSEAGLLGFLQGMGRWQRPVAINGRKSPSVAPVELRGPSTKPACTDDAKGHNWPTRLLLAAGLVAVLGACSPADVFHPAQTRVERPKAQSRTDSTRPQATTSTTLEPLPDSCYVDFSTCLVAPSAPTTTTLVPLPAECGEDMACIGEWMLTHPVPAP